jgi:hypothetical protein
MAWQGRLKVLTEANEVNGAKFISAHLPALHSPGEAGFPLFHTVEIPAIRVHLRLSAVKLGSRISDFGAARKADVKDRVFAFFAVNNVLRFCAFLRLKIAAAWNSTRPLSGGAPGWPNSGHAIYPDITCDPRVRE